MAGGLSKAAFDQAKLFIFRDIEREIELARASEDPEFAAQLLGRGISSGGGNFLAALALLCHTEFGGKLKFGHKRKDGADAAARNFNAFFDELGPEYRTLRSAHAIYDIFRCGLAHEFYVKRTCTIAMLEGGAPGPGIRIMGDGRYEFVVESYCRDLRNAFDRLESDLFGYGVVELHDALHESDVCIGLLWRCPHCGSANTALGPGPTRDTCRRRDGLTGCGRLYIVLDRQPVGHR